MARTKISKVAKDLNVALPTVVEFLRGKGIDVDDNPNARIEDDAVDILYKEFKTDKDQKQKSHQFSNERQQQKDKDKAKDAAAPQGSAEIKLTSEINKPKILGKIELDRHGNPVKPKPEPVVEKKPEVPASDAKAVEKAEAPAAPSPEPKLSLIHI